MMTQANRCRPTQKRNHSSRRQVNYFQHVPRVNMLRTKDTVIFQMAIPGIKKEDLKIRTENHLLKIHHSPSDQVERKMVTKGFDLTGFKRTFKLSDDVDVSQIAAQVDAGILHLELPLKEAAKPKTITIQ